MSLVHVSRFDATKNQVKPMAVDSTTIHLLAGGMGGTAGAVLTCPLEVVKTRLQSSVATFQKPVYVTNVTYVPPQPIASANYVTCCNGSVNTQTVTMAQARSRTTTSLYSCLKYIVQNEGAKALFKGLGPNLVGVAPSRAVYFCTYAQTKMFCNSVVAQPETPLVHICSAASAGFTASTLTNPIWFIKTRLQLDQKRHHGLTVGAVVRDVYKRHGLSGFYKGITASYYGIAETVIHFVIYEAIKARLRELKTQYSDVDERSAVDFLEFMAAGAVSKTCATCAAYPHEVARTRLRQEGGKYTGFWQTLRVVFMEEGVRGLYRGLATQLVRQIPNTAIMMSTYEFVVHMCSSPSYDDT